MKRNFITRTPEETGVLAARIGKALRGGELIALHGPLGAGKTRFVSGLAEGLGVLEQVSSPTFITLREMKGRCPLAHVDLYRVARADEIFELGILDYLESGWVVAIEWAEKGSPHLPGDRIDVRLSDEGESARRILVETSGEKLNRVLEGVGTFGTETVNPKK